MRLAPMSRQEVEQAIEEDRNKMRQELSKFVGFRRVLDVVSESVF